MIELLLQAERALSVGLLDRAETLYRQVAKADPRNSIAVVGLARVTLDRGDDVKALKLARKALKIDPENDAARRMVARLEEVLEFRDGIAELERGLDDRAPTPAASEGSADENLAVATAAAPESSAPESPNAEAVESEPLVESEAEVQSEGRVEAETPVESEPLVPSIPLAAIEGVGPEPTETSQLAPPEPAVEVSPTAGPVKPSEPRRRSWLDRLFRRG